MYSNRPIGIFDSGVGGLSVAKNIQHELPNEHFIYVADSAFAPYGEKSTEFITQRCHVICQFLVEQRVKAIVVACNTATVSCITQLRAAFDLPFIGMEPAIKPASLHSKTAVVGVLATQQTVQSGAVSRLVAQYSDNADIVVQACPGLVEMVENACVNSVQLTLLLRQYLQPMLDKGVDTIVMGCTHYAFLTPLIQSIVGEHITLLTSHGPVTKELQRRLEAISALANTDSNVGQSMFYTSALSPEAKQSFNQLWGSPVNLLSLPHHS
ncbi:MAG: glutamate racemase [Oceanospirillaceae bacterium]|nr:glutamate racemase [Oceanospirillaceae bacterium]